MMKILLILALSIMSLIAQNDYNQGKIDMHGGKNTYGSFGSRNYGGFSSSMGMSKFLDNNTSKKFEKAKSK